MLRKARFGGEMPITLKGMIVAIANVFVIALGMGIVKQNLVVSMIVVMYSGIPALVLGGMLGLFAGLTETRSRHWRTVLLSVPAFGLVVLLGAVFRLSEVVPIACVPTFIAALVLERWTRLVVPAPVPVATVRSMQA